MRISRQGESGGRPLSTADLAAAGRHADAVREGRNEERTPHEPDAELRASQAGADTGDEGVEAPDRPPVAATRDAPNRQPRAARPGTPDRRPATGTPGAGEEALVALFTPELTETYRARWISIQSSFVDDPRQAVRNGDELVAEVMTNLANTFADERHKVEAQLDETGAGSTENLRVALRRYHSFFERLLAL